jgi:hypothetical protein
VDIASSCGSENLTASLEKELCFMVEMKQDYENKCLKSPILRLRNDGASGFLWVDESVAHQNFYR